MILSYKSFLFFVAFLLVVAIAMIPTSASSAVENLSDVDIVMHSQFDENTHLNFFETERIITEREVVRSFPDGDPMLLLRLVKETRLYLGTHSSGLLDGERCLLNEDTYGATLDFTYKGTGFHVCLPVDSFVDTPIYYSMIKSEGTSPMSLYDVKKDDNLIFTTTKRGRDLTDVSIGLMVFDNISKMITGASHSDNGYASVDYSSKNNIPPCVVIFVGYEGYNGNGLFHQESDCHKIQPLYFLSNEVVGRNSEIEANSHALNFYNEIAMKGGHNFWAHTSEIPIVEEAIPPISFHSYPGHSSFYIKVDDRYDHMLVRNQPDCIYFNGKIYPCSTDGNIKPLYPLERPDLPGAYTITLIGLNYNVGYYNGKNIERRVSLNIQSEPSFFSTY